MIEVSRRQYLGAVAAAAATQLDAGEYEPEDVEPFDIWSFTPEEVLTTGEGSAAGWNLDTRDFDTTRSEVYYTPNNEVYFGVEGKADCGLNGGAQGSFTPSEAKEIATALYIAAEAAEAFSEDDR